MNEMAEINNNKKIKIINILLMILVLLVGVSISMAYFFDASGPITNIFSSPKPSLEVIEVDESDTISIKNTGNVAMYVRVHIQNLWEVNETVEGDSQLSSISAITPNPKDLAFELMNDWFSLTEEYYYYRKPVVAGSSVDFAKGMEFNGSKDGFTYQLNVLASGIQTNRDAVTEAWGIEIATEIFRQ